jgi:hypothetical protein
MKPCMLCGVTQSGVDKHNKEYESLVKMVLQTGNEKQLVNLIKIMSNVSIIPIEKYNEIHALINSAREAYED